MTVRADAQIDSASSSAQQEAYAIEGDYNLPIGGRNEYNGEEIKTRGEAVQIEKELRKRNYVLISTNGGILTDKEFDVFQEEGFWFCDYMNKDDLFKWTMGKVYVYKPLLEKFLRNHDKGITETLNTRIEIEQSAVVLAYEYWYSLDKAGEISDEFNDNIPAWSKPAYMEIDSPINIEIILLNYYQKTYYKFYVSKGTPFMVRLPQGQYNVVGLNTLDISKGEEALPYNNVIILTDDHNDRDHAYEVNISKLVSKYNIPEADISGTPDLSLDQNQNIPEEKTVVDKEAFEAARAKVNEENQRLQQIAEQEQENEESAPKSISKKNLYLIAGLLTVILTVIWVIADVKKRKTRYDDDE